MKYPQLTIRLDPEMARRLAVIALNENRSRGQVVKNAVQRFYGIAPPVRPSLYNRDGNCEGGFSRREIEQL